MLKAHPELWGCANFDTKWPICPNFFWKNQLYDFHVLLGPFNVQNLKKTLEWTKSFMTHFNSPTKFFFWKLFRVPFSHFYCVQFFKKDLSEWIQSYEVSSFSSPKWPICPERDFFGKPIRRACCVHSYQYYWYLKMINTEIWLQESIFGHNSTTRFIT